MVHAGVAVGGVVSANNLGRAMSAASDLAKEEPGARAYQLADEIDHLVGYWVTIDGKSVMSWPHQVAVAAGQPGRHRGPK